MTWLPDILPGYEQLTFDLPNLAPEAGEGGVVPVATLVRRSTPRSPRAVLSLNGWNDYFFQTHAADFWAGLGYDFYALDMRRYGRSLRSGQFPGYVTDLTQHFEELDLAWAELRREHSSVLLAAHSTGGLIGSLWAGARPGALAGVFLNSPWIAAQGDPVTRAAAKAVTRVVGKVRPDYVLPLPDGGAYAESLHKSLHGEWDYDLSLKRNPGGPIRPGWLRAVLAGHEVVAGGLGIEVPILVLTSDRTAYFFNWTPEAMNVDVVLDVDRIGRAAAGLGRHLTLVRIKGAVHDVLLSAAPVRAAAFEEIRRWEAVYLR